MTKAHLLALAGATLALAGCNSAADNSSAPANGATAATVAAPAGQDWTQVVTQTPEGGMLMGNPNAPVKLVEYLSLTCPHCAEFAEAGFPKLRDDYVTKGTVSLEIRNYVRDAVDMTATLVSRCGGPQTYFAMTEQALANQASIGQNLQAVPPAEAKRAEGLQPPQLFVAIAPMAGLDQFAKQRGITEQKLNQCLTDSTTINQLVEGVKKANEEVQIPGTPAFLLNGKLLQQAGTWEQLEPQLKAAGA